MSCKHIYLTGDGRMCGLTGEISPDCEFCMSYDTSCPAETNDVINKPKHYDYPIQPLEYAKPIIKEMDGFEGACTKDIIKYISRWKRKNGVEDIRKARFYCDALIEYLEKGGK